MPVVVSGAWRGRRDSLAGNAGCRTVRAAGLQWTFMSDGHTLIAVSQESSRTECFRSGAERVGDPGRVLAGVRLMEPELCIAVNYEGMSQAAAERVLDWIRCKPDALVCPATGASPALVYELLVEAGRRDAALFSQVRWLKPDEWAGLEPDEPGSSEHYLQERLLRPLGASADRYMGWNTMAQDAEGECRRTGEGLRRFGPIDICILGVGLDEHLAMNEPGAALYPGPHAVALSASMRRHAMLGGTGARVRHG
ncbi:MAG: 6-phosphogluconolactonase [Verrucomicrobiota bacterium]|nr:6-phosphogluconolactonase [Limisphaera sp.]MDW8381858.1 6-phosphogluconolactonase [Verrucomicrobiota bacterium]